MFPISPTTNPGATLALVLIFLGLVGAVVPILPGAPLIWLGAFVWALGDNFRHVDWITLIVLGVLALVATFSEYWLTPYTQRQAGFGWLNVAAAMVGGIAGGILLSEVPVVGTLFGAALGSVAGVSGVTLVQQRNVRLALRAGKAYLVGCAVSSAIEVALSLVMLAIFVWRAFFS